MVEKKTEHRRPSWVTNLPRAYWKNLEETEKLPPEPSPAPHTEAARALDHYYAFQHRQESLRQKASSQQLALTTRRNANLQDASRRYTTLYDRRQQSDRRSPATAAGYTTNRRKSADRRAAPPHASLFRHASLRDNSLPEEAVFLPQPALAPLPQEEAPIRIEGLAYPVSINGSMMHIGTASLTLTEWEAASDNYLLDHHGRKLLNFWRAHRDMLLGMAMEKA